MSADAKGDTNNRPYYGSCHGSCYGSYYGLIL